MNDMICNMLKTHIQALVYGRAAPCRRGVSEMIRCQTDHNAPVWPAPVLVRAHLAVVSVYPERKHQPCTCLVSKNRNVCFINLGPWGLALRGIIQSQSDNWPTRMDDQATHMVRIIRSTLKDTRLSELLWSLSSRGISETLILWYRNTFLC